MINNETSVKTTSKANPKHTIEVFFFAQWDLVCEGAALGEFAQTLLMAGQAAGAFLFTALADRYGRKPVVILCNMGLLVTGVGTGFVPNYTAFAALKFFNGALQQVTIQISRLVVELTQIYIVRQHRPRLSAF